MRRRMSLLLAAAAAMAGASASAQEDPTNIVADQIRAQGYKCDSPQSAKQDAQASKPDEAVWILQCESGSYRVRLVPDMAATVEKIDKSQDNGQVGGLTLRPRRCGRPRTGAKALASASRLRRESSGSW